VRFFTALPALAAVVISACHYDWTLPPGGAGGATSSSSSASSGGSMSSSSSGAGGAPVTAGCPASAPAPDAPCSADGALVCEYGADPRPGCRDRYVCSAIGWSLQPSAGASCDKLDACPPSAGGADCSAEGALCDEGKGFLCFCTSNGAALPRWLCDASPAAAGCPPPPYPNLGQPCDAAVKCSYGSCLAGTGVGRVCDNGVWAEIAPTCM